MDRLKSRLAVSRHGDHREHQAEGEAREEIVALTEEKRRAKHDVRDARPGDEGLSLALASTAFAVLRRSPFGEVAATIAETKTIKLGTGTIIVLDDRTCMVKYAQRIMMFYQHESCGWCIPCREGTDWLKKTLNRFHAGGGVKKDIDNMRAA